jgi:hypothetical protein
MLLRGFETLDQSPELGVKESLRLEFEALLAVPGAFHGPTKRRVRQVDEALGTSWGRVWIRLAQADRLSGDWTGNPPTKRKLRWDEPKTRDGEWVHSFRSVVDAVNATLERRIREATQTLTRDDFPSLEETQESVDQTETPDAEEKVAGEASGSFSEPEGASQPKPKRGRPRKSEKGVLERAPKSKSTRRKKDPKEMSVFELIE